MADDDEVADQIAESRKAINESRELLAKTDPMAEKRLKRPRDPVQLAKLIGDIATGQVEDRVEEKKDASAAALGRKGGKARAAKLTDAERSEIARTAARKRWHP